MADAALKAIGEALVGHCRAGTEKAGLDALYAPEAVSIEAEVMPGASGRETAGVEAIKGKHDWWDASTETHESKVEGPFLHGDDRFALIFEADVTMKDSGQRMRLREVAIYTVAAGKIVREEFYY
ncbi:MAG: nuclear transport factor 2 family protein [Pseudomonadota bacterium]